MKKIFLLLVGVFIVLFGTTCFAETPGVNTNNISESQNKEKWDSPIKEPIIRDYHCTYISYNGSKATNQGVDFAAKEGEPVKVVADGVVIYADCIGGYGLTVIIDHGDGLSTLYADCTKILVSLGEKVKAGQVICITGQTIYVCRPILHFEVRINGSPANPRDYLENIENS